MPKADQTEDTPSFDEFGLAPSIVSAIDALGFESPTPIQTDAIPVLLSGRDVIGGARTGSGKTAAFGLPLLHAMASAPRGGKGKRGGGVRALVLAPTRELAVQVTDALSSYAEGSGVEVATIYGGVSYGAQLRALRAGTPVIVGTPGRLLDHLDRGALDLSTVEMLVVDEADEMLRMGFIDDVERLLAATPESRQVALFSATMPDPIRRVAERYLKDPVAVQVEEESLTVEHIEQWGVIVPQRHKLDALERILAAQPYEAALVFARTRASCAEIAETLARRGMAVDALHGDMNQSARERVLDGLREQHLEVVIATDVAARGIDVSHITHVINLDIPGDTETYVHRIGRTGRAGRSGTAITFVTPIEARRLRHLERALRVRIEKMAVPTDADIVERRQHGLISDFREECTDEATEAFLADLVERAGLDERTVAIRALAMLARDRRVSLADDADRRPPYWARHAEERSRKGRQSKPASHRPRSRAEFDAGAVALYMPVGRDQGVKPADIVWGLTDATGMPGKLIGRITIHGKASFVGLPKDVARRVLDTVESLSIRGRDVPITLAKLQHKAGG